MVVITTKLHKVIPMVGANACATLKQLARGWILLHPLLLSLLWGVQHISQQGS